MAQCHFLVRGWEIQHIFAARYSGEGQFLAPNSQSWVSSLHKILGGDEPIIAAPNVVSDCRCVESFRKCDTLKKGQISDFWQQL